MLSHYKNGIFVEKARKIKILLLFSKYVSRYGFLHHFLGVETQCSLVIFIVAVVVYFFFFFFGLNLIIFIIWCTMRVCVCVDKFTWNFHVSISYSNQRGRYSIFHMPNIRGAVNSP